MPGVSTGDQIVREDISDLYINLDVQKTVFLTRLKKGEQLGNVQLFSWALEKYDGRLTTGIPEGADVDTFETDKQIKISGRSQKFWRRPHVTVESNEVNRAPADFGKYRKQVVKKTTEQKRDVEQKLFSDSDSRDDDGVNGREIMGLGRFINDTVSVGSAGAALTFTDPQTSITANAPDFLTPTAQIYVGNLFSIDPSGNLTLVFDDEQLLNMLQNRFDILGATSELSCFCDLVLKRQISRLSRYQKNVVNYTPTSRTMQESIAAKNYLMFGADLLETDFGPIDVNLVSWMPRTSTGAASGRGYFIDMEFMYMRPSGLWLTHRELEDKGGGPRGLIQSILGPQYGDPRGHLKVDPNVVQGTF